MHMRNTLLLNSLIDISRAWFRSALVQVTGLIFSACSIPANLLPTLDDLIWRVRNSTEKIFARLAVRSDITEDVWSPVCSAIITNILVIYKYISFLKTLNVGHRVSHHLPSQKAGQFQIKYGPLLFWLNFYRDVHRAPTDTTATASPHQSNLSAITSFILLVHRWKRGWEKR
jgi:hypothetical protein